MAYCNKCGAYIPDNQIKCLACGYDESAAAAAAQQENERAEAEARRRAQQEENRRWAEEERRRRQEEENRRWAEAERQRREQEEAMARRREAAAKARMQHQQELDARWSEAEKIRRQREEEARTRWEEEKARREAMGSERSFDFSDEMKKMGDAVLKNEHSSKIMGVLSYLSLLFLVPMFLAKDDRKAYFHAKQGMRLFIFNAISDAATAVFPIFGLLKLFSLYCTIKGISNVVNDREEPLPYIGEIKF